MALDADDRPCPEAQVLIDGTAANCSGALCLESADQGLKQPEGLAVWHGKSQAVLFVADVSAQKIFSYPISQSAAFNSVVAGAQTTVAKDLGSVAGLALDGFGNLYFTTIDGLVGKLGSDQLAGSNPVPTTLYTSDSQKTVSSPFGLAADSFHLYWANQANGQTNGAIVKAFERDAETLAKKYPDYPKMMAKNLAKASGVCIAKNNVFFTAQAQILYGMKTTGGSIAEVSRSFQTPRGCAYDGENTLYVADAQAKAVFTLPANFPTLRPVKKVQKAVTLKGAPSSVAVFTCAPPYQAKPADTGFLGLGW